VGPGGGGGWRLVSLDGVLEIPEPLSDPLAELRKLVGPEDDDHDEKDDEELWDAE
jgi:hypothetical protein